MRPLIVFPLSDCEAFVCRWANRAMVLLGGAVIVLMAKGVM